MTGVFSFMAINVPRVQDVTGKRTMESVRDERDWQRSRREFIAYSKLNKYSKEAWKRRVDQTRSF